MNNTTQTSNLKNSQTLYITSLRFFFELTYFIIKIPFVFIVPSVQFIDDEYLLNYRITEREKELICLILKQKSSIDIAKELLISKRTVEAHRNNIIIKLNVKNSVGIAVKLLQA